MAVIHRVFMLIDAKQNWQRSTHFAGC